MENIDDKQNKKIHSKINDDELNKKIKSKNI